MYICRDCGEVFSETGTRYEHGSFWGTPYTESYSCCPCCGGEYSDAVQCPVCGEWFAEGEIGEICDDCYNEMTLKKQDECFDILLENAKENNDVENLIKTILTDAKFDIIGLIKEKVKTDENFKRAVMDYIVEDMDFFKSIVAEKYEKSNG